MEAKSTEKIKKIYNSLYPFLEDLRLNHGFSTGTDTCINIQNLLIKLAAINQLPKNIIELADFISPLICTTPIEQNNFKSLYNNWFYKDLKMDFLKQDNTAAGNIKELKKTGKKIIIIICITFINNPLAFRISKFIYRLFKTSSFIVKQKDNYEKNKKRNPKNIIKNIKPLKNIVSKNEWIDPVTGMEFVWIEGGCYMMGQSEKEKEMLIKEAGKEDYDKYYKRELPRHEVCVDGFWLGKYPVTIEQFKKFVEETEYVTDAEKGDGAYVLLDGEYQQKKGYYWKKTGFDQDDDHPVVTISWNDAKAMLKWMSDKGDNTFSLPSEAQWEYACRGGTDTIRFWGDDSDQACQYANVADQSLSKYYSKNWNVHNCDDGYSHTSPVGNYLPNPFKLYDMLGNVWEWCEDSYSEDAYSKHVKNNPINESNGASFRVLRGGSWDSDPRGVRCAYRDRDIPVGCDSVTGFRVLMAK